MNADIRIGNCGSIFLARPLTPQGQAAIDEILAGNDEAQLFGSALVIEHSFVLSIIDAFRNDFGLAVA